MSASRATRFKHHDSSLTFLTAHVDAEAALRWYSVAAISTVHKTSLLGGGLYAAPLNDRGTATQAGPTAVREDALAALRSRLIRQRLMVSCLHCCQQSKHVSLFEHPVFTFTNSQRRFVITIKPVYGWATSIWASELVGIAEEKAQQMMCSLSQVRAGVTLMEESLEDQCFRGSWF